MQFQVEVSNAAGLPCLTIYSLETGSGLVVPRQLFRGPKADDQLRQLIEELGMPLKPSRFEVVEDGKPGLERWLSEYFRDIRMPDAWTEMLTDRVMQKVREALGDDGYPGQYL